jgi:hypothetical protein
MKRRNKPLIFMFAAIGAALLAGCSNQSEGERCSRLAGSTGNDDCESGLTCQLVGSLELCCPTDRVSSVPECIASTNLPDAGTSVVDASDAATGSTDATDATDATEDSSGI